LTNNFTSVKIYVKTVKICYDIRKIRRRIEDYLRKEAEDEEILGIARTLNIKLD